MDKEKQIKSTDWLTKGYSEEEVVRMKAEAIKEANAELRKKQIEEMAKAVCHLDRTCDECMTSFECKAMMYAKRFYDAGYRKIPDNIGEFSDGYHTFNELYHHRAILFSVICNGLPDNAWKSKLHDTGDMYDGMFIVGIETPEGQATYHYDIEPYWDMFNVKELEKAPKWDGHTPQVAIERIAKLNFGVIRLWENLLKAEAQEVPIKAEKIKVAREIFEEIEASEKVKYWRGGGLVVFEVNGEDFAELKKRYTQDKGRDKIAEFGKYSPLSWRNTEEGK